MAQHLLVMIKILLWAGEVAPQALTGPKMLTERNDRQQEVIVSGDKVDIRQVFIMVQNYNCVQMCGSGCLVDCQSRYLTVSRN